MSPSALLQRLDNGWSVRRALTEAVTNRRGHFKHYVRLKGGPRQTLAACAEAHGVPLQTAHSRIHAGWPKTKAATVPVGTFMGKRLAPFRH